MSLLALFPLKDWRLAYGLTAMVETGTHRGAGVAAAFEAGFPKVFSCDVSVEFVSLAAGFFDTYVQEDSLILHALSSEQALPLMLSALSGPALFFLDAHVNPSMFASDLVDTDANPLPLMRELEIIRQIRGDCERDVFVLDDMAFYLQQYWIGPDQTRIMKLPDCVPELRDAEHLVSLFFPKHTWSVVQNPDVALVLLPRGGR